jgi:hypothetical protein
VAEGEHYREAERLSRVTLRWPQKDISELPIGDAVAVAQVHATLAVADQLARVAEMLNTLIQVQQERR